MNPETTRVDEQRNASRRMARKRALEICFEASFYELNDVKEFVHDRVDNPLEFDPTDPEGNITATFQGENLKFIERISVLAILNATTLDEILMKYPHDWSYERIGLPEKVILRIALTELTLMETPVKIVINEALDLAKAYGERDANKFVNGILGSIVHDLKKIMKETVFARE